MLSISLSISLSLSFSVSLSLCCSCSWFPSRSASSVWNHKVCLAQFASSVWALGIYGYLWVFVGFFVKVFAIKVSVLLFVVVEIFCCLFLFLFCCGYLDFFPLHQKCMASPIWIVEFVILITSGTSLQLNHYNHNVVWTFIKQNGKKKKKNSKIDD